MSELHKWRCSVSRHYAAIETERRGVVKFQNSVYVFGGNTKLPFNHVRRCQYEVVEATACNTFAQGGIQRLYQQDCLGVPDAQCLCARSIQSYRTLEISFVSNYYGSVSFLSNGLLKLITYDQDFITVTLDSAEKVTENIYQAWCVDYSDCKVVRFEIANNFLRELKSKSLLQAKAKELSVTRRSLFNKTVDSSFFSQIYFCVFHSIPSLCEVV